MVRGRISRLYRRGGTWCAITSAGEVLTGATPDELAGAIRAHWQAMRE